MAETKGPGLDRRAAFNAAAAQGDSNYLASAVNPVFTPLGDFIGALGGRTVEGQRAIEAQRTGRAPTTDTKVAVKTSPPATPVASDRTPTERLLALGKSDGGVVYTPIEDINMDTPEQAATRARITAASEALAGLTPNAFRSLMSSLPEAPSAPAIEDVIQGTLFEKATQNYVAEMQAAMAAQSQEAAVAAENRYTGWLLEMLKGDSFRAPKYTTVP